ncbi:MAG TPA: NADH-quinone oxidoreductase subunit C [Aggregatilineales bacterium]|nr:NADH-quinone oxidoreductase subunit C [Aggregatilineales bacterium]
MSGYYPPEFADILRENFPDAVQEVIEFRDQITVVIDRDWLIEIATFLRDTEGMKFNYLSELNGVDYWPQAPRFGINYIFYSFVHNHLIQLKIFVDETDPVVPSLTSVFPGANWPEHEVYDMFGVRFEGHPDMRRILMPYDWTGHPLRKDFPLGYEEVQYTFNIDRIEANKPTPSADPPQTGTE